MSLAIRHPGTDPRRQETGGRPEQPRLGEPVSARDRRMPEAGPVRRKGVEGGWGRSDGTHPSPSLGHARRRAAAAGRVAKRRGARESGSGGPWEVPAVEKEPRRASPETEEKRRARRGDDRPTPLPNFIPLNRTTCPAGRDPQLPRSRARPDPRRYTGQSTGQGPPRDRRAAGRGRGAGTTPTKASARRTGIRARLAAALPSESQ